MKRNLNSIEALRYSIKRYQEMGNGVMCQNLNTKLRKLMAAQGR